MSRSAWRRKGGRLAAITAMGAALVAVPVGSAVAVDGDRSPAAVQNPEEFMPRAPNLDFVENACAGTKYKFRFHWSSSMSTAWRNLGYAEWDLGSVAQGGTINANQALTFCGGKGKGYGQKIKNNSTAAENSHSKYRGFVYYNSGYKGAVDTVPTMSSMKLKKTFNNNASFMWKS